MKKTVAFILGLSHSGSTLLGHVIGSHPQAIHTGEIVSPLRKGKPVRCRLCGEQQCSIWGTMISEDFVKRCYRSYLDYLDESRSRFQLIKRARMYSKRLLGLSEPPGSLFVRLFVGLPTADIIVMDRRISIGLNGTAKGQNTEQFTFF